MAGRAPSRYTDAVMRRYTGLVGEDVAIGQCDGPAVVRLIRASVLRSVKRKTGEAIAVNLGGTTWFRRDNGARVNVRGLPVKTGGKFRLVGPWLPAYGETDITGIDACKAALRAGEAMGVTDPRQRALAQSVTEVCGLFGVDPDTLKDRLAAEPKDVDALTHNGLRKFAVGAIIHLAYEIDVAWSGRINATPRQGVKVINATPRQGVKVINEVPQLQGLHRATLGSFRLQFAHLCGLGDDAHGRLLEPKSEVGRFLRDRYAQIRRAAVEAAAHGE